MKFEFISGIIEFNSGGETMLAKIAALGLENWTVEEKRELLDAVSDSLDDIEGEEFEVPAWHLEEIERRLKNREANPQTSMPLKQFLDELEAMP